MHRYEELLRKYYIKKATQIVGVIAIFLAVGLAAFFYSQKSDNKVTKKETNQVKVTEVNKTKPVVVQKEEKPLKTAQEDKKPVEKKVQKEEKEKKLSFILPEINQTKEVKKEKKPKVATETKPNKKLPKIITKTPSLSELIKSFNNNKSYSLALMISKKYYQKGKLREAKLWVLRANELNPEDVDSWLLFADILLKEGKKDRAKEVLNTYIQTYGKNDKIVEKLRSIR